MKSTELKWDDKKLLEAAKQYKMLNDSQINFFITKRKTNLEFAYKAYNYSIMSAWAYTAGILEDNNVRLKKHFELHKSSTTDPLNAIVLSKGRHKTDPPNYRGLGTRTDKKERGRLSELFYIQAEKGSGITKALIDVAIQKYHVKLANLELREAESRLK